MHTTRVRIAALASPVLMVVVALFGTWQHSMHDQSSWSGASFGMFATIDAEATRQVRAFIERDGNPTPLSIPEELERRAFEVQVLPTEERLARLGREWVELTELEAGAEVVVEVWGIDFNSAEAALSRILIQRVTVRP